MRYNSLKGLLLQISLLLGMSSVFLVPAIIAETQSSGSDRGVFVFLASFLLFFLIPIIRGAVLKKKISDYPRKGKIKGIVLWIISYIIALIVFSGILTATGTMKGPSGMAIFFPTVLLSTTVAIAIRDSFLTRSKSTEDRRRKRWSTNRHIRYYSFKGFMVQLLYFSLFAVLISAGLIIRLVFGVNTVAITAALILWSAAVILFLIRDKLLYRFISDIPKRSFGKMIAKGLGFLAIFVVIFSICFEILSSIATTTQYTNVVNDEWYAVPQRVTNTKDITAIIITLLVLQLAVMVALRDYFLMKSEYKKKSFVCPYCLAKNLIWSAQYRCTNKACAEVPDIELTQYENGNTSNPIRKNKTFPAIFKKIQFQLIPKHGNCPDCNSKSTKIVCPSCHNSIPESSLLGEDIIFSIVGSHASGKSHFLGVLINELKERIAGSFHGSLVGLNDSAARYEKNFKQKLYSEKSTLDFTESFLSGKSSGAFKPLIFKLSTGAGKKKHTLVFYETAGVDLDDLDTMSTVNKFISKSSGIVFLLDPMQIPAVANQLDDTIIACASGQNASGRHLTARSDDVLGRVSTRIREDNNIKSSQKIDIPTAAVLSKLDAIKPFVPSGLTLSTLSPHFSNRGFVLSDWESVNSETQDLLRNWGEGSFMAQLDVNYEKQSYFAVSALGLNNSPREDKKIAPPQPHRIEDPLLWLMKENNIIKTI